MNTDDLLTITEAASALGISRAALYDAIQNGRLAAVTVLGKQVLRRADVAAYEPRSYRDRPGGKSKGGRRKQTDPTPTGADPDRKEAAHERPE